MSEKETAGERESETAGEKVRQVLAKPEAEVGKCQCQIVDSGRSRNEQTFRRTLQYHDIGNFPNTSARVVYATPFAAVATALT